MKKTIQYLMIYCVALIIQSLNGFCIKNDSKVNVIVCGFENKDDYRRFRNRSGKVRMLNSKFEVLKAGNNICLNTTQKNISRLYFAIMNEKHEVLWASFLNLIGNYVLTGPINGNYHVTEQKNNPVQQKTTEK